MKQLRSYLIVILFLSMQNVWADEPIRMRSCRVGQSNQQNDVPRRAPADLGDENPFIGVRHQLVVLVSFADMQMKDADPLSLWYRIFNEPGFNENSFKGSVHDYFYEQSYGKFDLTFDLQYIQLSEERVKYRSTAYDDENSKYLVNDIVDTLLKRGIDWAPYAWNEKGIVNQLLIVYAGKGQNAGGGTNSIWPHQWWLSKHDGCEARTFTQHDKEYVVDCYCCVSELYSNNTYGTFGTICHEYSHCFGLPDLYYGTTSYVKDWDLMDYGNNNGNGFQPCGYSAHEKMFMGWLKPTELKDPVKINNMGALANTQEAYIIYSDGDPHEYYIVENRQPIGWDESLPGCGILVFHVTYDEDIWYGNVNDIVNSSKMKRYYIFPANGSFSVSDVAGWAYPYEGNHELTDSSDPIAVTYSDNKKGEKLMSKPLTNMEVSNGIANFNFMHTEPSSIQIIAPSAEDYTHLYQFGPVSVVRTASGDVKKIIISKK